MARSVLDIIIRLAKQGGADKETVKGLTEIKNTVNTIVPAFLAFVGAAYAVDKVLQATVGEYVKYADEVEHAKQLTGASAEETSRVIQLADDLGISYEQLAKSLKAANKDGVQPNIEGLAALSDQFLAIQDPVKQSQFLLDKFGKEGIDMSKIMKLGGDGVKEWAASIDDSLIITEQGIQKAHEYEMAVDAWKDSIQGAKYQAGTTFLPILTDLLNSWNDNARAIDIAREAGATYHTAGTIAYAAALKQAQGEREHAAALREAKSAMDDAGQSSEELSAHYKDLLDTTMSLQEGSDRFKEKELQIRDSMAEAANAVTTGQITVEEYNKRISDLSGELDDNAKAAQQWSKKFVFSMIQARLAASGGGIDKGEFAFLIQLGEQMDLIDEKTATMAENINDSLDDIDLSKPQNFSNLWKQILGLPSDKEFNITVFGTTITSGGGGGGTRRAIGGAFDMGVPMLVHKDEIVVPDYSGVVLTRTDAMRLLSGKNDNSAGRKVTIYGGVTVVAQGSVMNVLDELS